jgi:hypothetical protein
LHNISKDINKYCRVDCTLCLKEFKEGQKKEYTVFFVPRRTMICERVLEEEGVWNDITFREYQLDLIPFDDDILSLELDSAYKECFLVPPSSSSSSTSSSTA